MSVIAYFVQFLLKFVPMSGQRTYIVGGLGLLLAIALLVSGDYATGGTLATLALQGIFQRYATANTEVNTSKLESALASAVAEIVQLRTHIAATTVSLPELPDSLATPTPENNATGASIF